MNLGLKTQLDLPYEAAFAHIEAALKAEGFGILTEIDVQDTLKKKLDVDFQPYKILGACNPSLAHRALSNSPDVGLLLPCNVTVSQIEDGKTQVAIMDPLMMVNVLDDDKLKPIAAEAHEHLTRVIEALEKNHATV